MLNFTSGRELLELCSQQDCTISRAMINREVRYFGSDEETDDAYKKIKDVSTYLINDYSSGDGDKIIVEYID